MLWQGEREVMWDTVQMQATHTLQLSRQRRDEAEAEALYSSLAEAHARLRGSGGAGAGASGMGTATHFMQLDNFKNTQYSGEVSVGTPPQSMRVIFDTGSANFWLYARDCKSLACQLHATYDRRLSSTYRPAARSKWPSLWGRSWPPQDPQAASEGLRPPSALGRRGPAPPIPQPACGLGATPCPSRHFRCA